MPFTAENLLTAILANDLDGVQEILAERNNQGIPHADINYAPYNDLTLLMIAIASGYGRQINQNIIQALLDVRDNNNNPVININAVGSHGRTALALLLGASGNAITLTERRQLLQRMIDLRGARGELVVDLGAHQGNLTLLEIALDLDDVNVMQILLDARIANGDHALDVNEINYRNTVLDCASSNGLYYRRNNQIIQAIRAAGGLRFEEIPPEQQALHDRYIRRNAQPILQATPIVLDPQARPEQKVMPEQKERPEQKVIPEQKEQKEVQEQEAFATFVQDTQNTHSTEVNVTVTSSIKKLQQRYTNLKIQHSLKEIDTFLTNVPSSHKHKKKATECFNRIQTTIGEHSYTQITLAHALALIWTGIKDKNEDAAPPGQKIDDNYVNLRKESLLEKLFEAETAYPNSNACFTGTFNKIVEALNHAHADVVVVTGKAAVKPAAQDSARDFMRAALLKKTLREQKIILKEWADNDSKSAGGFRRSMVAVVHKNLEEIYGTLLTKADREEITNNFDYLPIPVVHDNLSRLEETIAALAGEQKDPYVATMISKLKDQATHIYDDNELSFQQVYEALNEALNKFYQVYQKITHVLTQKYFFTLKITNIDFFDYAIYLQNLKKKDNKSYLKRLPDYLKVMEKLATLSGSTSDLEQNKIVDDTVKMLKAIADKYSASVSLGSFTFHLPVQTQTQTEIINRILGSDPQQMNARVKQFYKDFQEFNKNHPQCFSGLIPQQSENEFEIIDSNEVADYTSQIKPSN